ncbi:MAG: ferritin [Candidatus Auribacterota bacterium]|nr:ferritin [Candidatus Auribacterota bacterium]
MLSEKMQEALNIQINKEIYSAYLYLSMAAYCDSVNLKGLSSWMTVQVQEELSHARKFFNYLPERGAKVILQPIDGPQIEWDSPLAVFEHVYEHEQLVTSLINGLVKLAREEDDYATESFLKWFIDEQVEEEASASEVVEKLKLAGDRGSGLFMLDRELGARVFTPPTA